MLAITGAEALYADMGHFGRAPITRAWLLLVFPACILNYMGQGALILGDPAKNIASPFFLLVPHWGRVPMVVLATVATVIASQAVITGAFSVTHQAVQLGYLPRLRILHTSEETVGQVYVPWINWVLMVSVLTLVFAFQTSTALAFAYGMAVTGTITITTLLFFYIVRSQWGKPLWLVVAGAGAFLTVDLFFFAANLTKIFHGAWLPLLIGVTVFTVLTTWQRGRELVTERREADEGSLREFVDQLHDRRPAAAAGSRHRRLPQPQQRDDPAGDARQRRAQPDPARARGDPLDRDPAGPARRTRRAHRGRRPRLLRRRHRARLRALRLHGRAQRARRARPRRPRPASSARSRSTRPPTSSRRSTSAWGMARACPPGASACSSPPRTSPPTPPSTSACPATGR